MRCSEISFSLGEPLPGTAPHARGVICIEHVGPWAAKAVAGTGSDDLVELERRAQTRGIRVQLVRPPGARRSDERIFLAGFTTGHLERIDSADPAMLDDQALDTLACGEPTGLGQPERDPLYLVCTHGRRDACCALFGTKVARVLADRFPGRVFESSHLGGHRFAANLLALPYGLLFGRLDEASAIGVVAAVDRGEIEGDAHLRGSAVRSPAEQVAEAHVRRGLGLHRVEAVRGEEIAREEMGAGTRRTVIQVAIEGREPLLVEIESTLAEARPVSCGAAPEPVENYAVLGADPPFEGRSL